MSNVNFRQSRKEEKRINDRELLKMLLEMVNRDNVNKDNGIDIVEFVSRLQLMMRDEFNSEVNIVGLNTLAITFLSGEQFAIRVENGCITGFGFDNK